jgi:hypothetical protein
VAVIKRPATAVFVPAFAIRSGLPAPVVVLGMNRIGPPDWAFAPSGG